MSQKRMQSLPNTDVVMNNYSKPRASSVNNKRKKPSSSKSSFSPAHLSFYKFIRNYAGSRVNPSKFYKLPQYFVFLFSKASDNNDNKENFLPRMITYDDIKIVFNFTFDNISFPNGVDLSSSRSVTSGYFYDQ